MIDLSPLVWLVAIQLLLYAAGWVLGSVLMCEQRAAAAHWGVFMLLVGAGFALTSQRGEPRTWAAFVGSNILFIAGYLALRRGLECFLGAAPKDREHLVTWGLVVLLLTGLGPGQEHASARVLVAYGAAVWILLRMMAEALPPLRAEFGMRLVGFVSVPAVLVLLMSIDRMVRQALDFGHPLELQRLHEGNRPVLYGYLVGAAMFNFSFTGLLATRLVQSLRHLSQSDPLTGLLNRRALEAQLEREVLRARRNRNAFAVLALDLDHFKRVNDSHGHPVGDAVLKQVSQRLLRTARQTDCVARTGGEEFIVLMPDTTAEGALRAAQRLRQSIDQAPFPIESLASALPLTISIGFALAAPGEADSGALMQRADQALYQAKAEGRNHVVLQAMPA